MKILHVTPSYWPAARYGGTIRSVHGLCAGLVTLGHRVLVLTTNVDGPGVCDVPLDRLAERDGVAIRYFPIGLGRRFYRSPALGNALRREIAGGTDVVHLHAAYLWPGWAAARAAAAAGVPYVVSPRGMLVRELIERRSRLAKRLWIDLIERRTLACAAAIHVTSGVEAAALRDLGLDLAPLLEVPNGVDLPPPSPPGGAAPVVPDDSAWGGAVPGRRLLYLGRINWKKGLDRLIPALARLPDTVLVVAGNDEEELTPRLRRLAAETGVGDRVRLVGAVDGERKWGLLRASDLLVLPSLSENFGLVVLEALTVGTPVVVTPGVGAAEIVAQHGAGLVAPGGDPEALAAAVAPLLVNPRRRHAMGERGAALVRERYGWPAVARRMSDAYAEIIAPGCHGGPPPAARREPSRAPRVELHP